MKKFLYLAAACLLAACNGGEEPEQQPSLEVKRRKSAGFWRLSRCL